MVAEIIEIAFVAQINADDTCVETDTRLIAPRRAFEFFSVIRIARKIRTSVDVYVRHWPRIEAERAEFCANHKRDVNVAKRFTSSRINR